MDKTLIKTVTKTKGEGTEDVYYKLHLEKQLLQNSFLCHLLRTSEENAKAQ